jgi:hypothetical protein
MPAFLRRASLLLAALLLAAAGPAAAQSSSAEANSSEPAASGDCRTDLSEPMFMEDRTGASSSSSSDDAAAGAPTPATTPAEERVKEILAEQGVHVVRLWAPWCPNSTGEMADGAWDDLAAENADASFTFVTVWNDGNGGAGKIEKYGLPLGKRITEVVPAAPEQGRLDQFMGHAVNWVPSTWIFRTPDEGETERAFALNYGEMNRATLQTLIDAAGNDW